VTSTRHSSDSNASRRYLFSGSIRSDLRNSMTDPARSCSAFGTLNKPYTRSPEAFEPYIRGRYSGRSAPCRASGKHSK
jgi:hypothetical protein